jgi:hypothetical protein
MRSKFPFGIQRFIFKALSRKNNEKKNCHHVIYSEKLPFLLGLNKFFLSEGDLNARKSFATFSGFVKYSALYVKELAKCDRLSSSLLCIIKTERRLCFPAQSAFRLWGISYDNFHIYKIHTIW